MSKYEDVLNQLMKEMKVNTKLETEQDIIKESIRLTTMKQEQQYIDLLKKIIKEGCKKQLKYGDRVLDNYCLSLFGESLKFDCRDWTLPLYTHRKINWKLGLKEMIWLIQGDGDVISLHKSGVKYWDEWGVKYYNQKYKTNWSLEEYRTEIKEGRLKELLLPLHYTNSTNLYIEQDEFDEWNYRHTVSTRLINQTKWVINTLRKNPDARHCLVSYWRPEDTYEMAEQLDRDSVILPACHHTYTVNINNGLVCLDLGVRSNDWIKGNPTNVSQYAFLLFMYAKCLNRKPGYLKINITDLHLYSDHLDILSKNIDLDNPNLYEFPKVEIADKEYNYLEDFTFEDFNVIGYKSNPVVKFPITVVGGY